MQSSTTRRIFVSVAYEGEEDGSPPRKSRKCAISLPSISSNADLLTEIATTFDVSRESVTLEIGGGFELRMQDSIETLAPDDIVTARVTIPSIISSATATSDARQESNSNMNIHGKRFRSSTPAPALNVPRTTSAGTKLVNGRLMIEPGSNLFNRKILFVTAEMVRRHARTKPKDTEEPMAAGIFAFGGSYVSGDITLGAIKTEARRLLCLPPSSKDSDHMEIGHECACKGQNSSSDNGLKCSCALAEEIERHGMLSTMHCRFRIDGSNCPHGIKCPYSHAPLNTTSKSPPHCSICEEALGFPCPTCENKLSSANMDPEDFIYCPLVSNAGCGHLHHAHCLGLHLSSGNSQKFTSASCPSGCSFSKYPREQRNFFLQHSTSSRSPSTSSSQAGSSSEAGSDEAYIIVAWDGDRLDQIPIPDTLFVLPRVRRHSVCVKMETIVSLVREFLVEKGYMVPGLTVRVHKRDTVADQVRLTQWTLVSVCVSSAHSEGDLQRFKLFSAKTMSGTPTPAPLNTSLKGKEFLGEGCEAVEIDLHTSSYPILACDCTPLEKLFPLSSSLYQAQTKGTSASSISDSGSGSDLLLLYVVPRATHIRQPPSTANTNTTTTSTGGKSTTFLNGPAWHPHEAQQTARGISALLSSLYVLAEYVAHHDNETVAMRNMVTMMWMITRFPPAVRSLALIIENLTLLPQEKAALASSLYYTLKEFAYEAPKVIVDDPSRTFETARILLGLILPAANVPMPSTAPATSSVLLSLKDSSEEPTSESSITESISLTCISSRNRLQDPVLFEGVLTERSFANLHLPGKELYRPSHPDNILSAEQNNFFGAIRELPSSSIVLQVVRAAAATKNSSDTAERSMTILHVSRIRGAPPSCAFTLESAGRDFNQAIRSVNKGKLVMRAPLDLKAPALFPPQLVLDGEGLIAVFTGRGCGSTRDVNFFRPSSGGDTEVDVNDVANALDKVVPSRKVEGTWGLDSFSGGEVTCRNPEEAIVMCLDLSRSMTEASGIGDGHSRSRRQEPTEEEKSMRETKEDQYINELVANLDTEERLHRAKMVIDRSHWTSHQAWKAWINHFRKISSYDSDDSDEEEEPSVKLIEELRLVARKDVFNLKRLNVPRYGGANIFDSENMACFAWSCKVYKERMANHLDSVASQSTMDGKELVGRGVFVIPREFMDPKTGDILLSPVALSNSKSTIYVNENSLAWFQDLDHLPGGPFVEQSLTARQLKSAISKWVSGNELQAPQRCKSKILRVKLVHDQKSFNWRVLSTTTAQELYSLANRATGAKYRDFTIVMKESGNQITNASYLMLASTELAHGGTIELTGTLLHDRAPYMLTVKETALRGIKDQVFILPRETTLTALCCFMHPEYYPLSEIAVWYDLHSIGDHHRAGSVLYSTMMDDRLESRMIPHGRTHKLELAMRRDEPSQQERSRYLTRLHLLQELFNVFLNRACSFDTSVPLVLGLVTFSDKAKIAQELTPLFEQFRETLTKLSADGDTALYDALDLARSMLVNYRTDLPALRKRIIMVSDGEDTASKSTALEVCAKLQKDKIIVDSVQVGSSSDRFLHAISVATGGYRFSPQTSLTDALSIFDLETVLNSGERPKIKSMPQVRTLTELRNVYGDQRQYPTDIVTIDQFPKRAEHARLRESALPIAMANTRSRMLSAKDDRIKRIMLEIRNLVAKQEEWMDIYVDDKDMTFLRIIMEPPKDVDCLYRNGVYQLTCEFPAGYPRDPPEIRFVNFIMHPNVSKQGKVCIAELGRMWTSDISMVTALQLVYQIFSHPDLENPLETQASLKFYDNDGSYASAVGQAVKTHASKTRDEWREELENL